MSQPETSRLFSLPRELRERIFIFAIADDRQNFSYAADVLTAPSFGYLMIPHLPPFVQICRQAYHETSALYYRESLLRFRLPSEVSGGPGPVKRWINCPTRSPAHRSIVLKSCRRFCFVFPISREHQCSRIYGPSRRFDVTIDAHLDNNGKLCLSYTGQLLSSCVCIFQGIADECNQAPPLAGSLPTNRLVRFALQLERVVGRTELDRNVPEVKTCFSPRSAAQWGEKGPDFGEGPSFNHPWA